MTKMMIVSFLSVIAITAQAQKVAVSVMKQNQVIAGEANPLMIVAENCSCNNLIVTTDNGNIAKQQDCNFLYTPHKAGLAQILVSCSGRKGALNYLMRVIDSVSTPMVLTPLVAKKNGGKISTNEMKAQLGIYVLNASGNDVSYKMEYFTYSLIRNNQVLFTKFNKGPYFDIDVKRSIENVKSGDKVIFYNMECSAPKQPVRTLAPMEFYIVN